MQEQKWIQYLTRSYTPPWGGLTSLEIPGLLVFAFRVIRVPGEDLLKKDSIGAHGCTYRSNDSACFCVILEPFLFFGSTLALLSRRSIHIE